MLTHPQFDPVAFSIGPLSVRWYGLAYLAAFIAFAILARLHARRRLELGWKGAEIDDLLFYGIFGVILGARLGEVLFYQPGWFLSHPLEIFAIWKGGMSFHGGFLGVLLAMWLYGRLHQRGFWEITDFIAPMVPIGLAAGRIGNFINGELYGRLASESLPWAMRYPQVDNLPRHPSQLYQAAGEGLLLFILLWWFASRPRPLRMVSGAFLAGYGVLRFAAEFFRTPDPGIFSELGLGLTTAQWLCVPMVAIGAYLIACACSSRQS
ncbi:MAG: prolipoprotein diacylglyceryl transferase [Azoarcus sp.]|jgi:phosphatidylglycerol:prolipoprotein diacylglycerol transferase|nr:prolipoprotein diacylglyceryl transferase [Azoarcus sp.]